MYARIEELQKPVEPSKHRKQSKSFGTSLAEWMGNLSATESCLYLAEFDVEKALKLYWEEDYLLVQEAIKVKSAYESSSLYRLTHYLETQVLRLVRLQRVQPRCIVSCSHLIRSFLSFWRSSTERLVI